jgi:hypothetical protein
MADSAGQSPGCRLGSSACRVHPLQQKAVKSNNEVRYFVIIAHLVAFRKTYFVLAHFSDRQAFVIYRRSHQMQLFA